MAFALWILMLVKSYRALPRLRARTWLVFIPLIVVLPLAQREFAKVLVQPFSMPTGGMAPTIQGIVKQPDGTETTGDRLWVEKYAYWFSKPRRGDIVVFTTAGLNSPLLTDSYYVKRIVGVPGDLLTIRDGRLLNHGKQISEPAMLAKMIITNPRGVNPLLLETPEPMQSSSAKPGFPIPPDCYFVMGDNTGNSLDSRFWGPVAESNIVGRASKLYWPLDRAGRIY